MKFIGRKWWVSFIFQSVLFHTCFAASHMDSSTSSMSPLATSSMSPRKLDITKMEQEEWNRECGKIAREVYGTINQNVTFSGKCSTKSRYWKLEKILNVNFFVKERGVLLSFAIEDLLQPQSNTHFDCAVALNIYHMHLYLLLGFDEVIHTFESEDQNFQLPLMAEGVLNILTGQATGCGFHVRDDIAVAKTAGKEDSFSVSTKKEWEKITTVTDALESFAILNYCLQPVPQKKTIASSVEGGFLYMGSIPTAPGENLVCITEELYYGFSGNLFKEGPLPLSAIAQSLEKALDKKAYSGWVKEIEKGRRDAARTQGKQFVTLEKKGLHPFQFKVDSGLCQYLDIKILKRIIKEINKKTQHSKSDA